MPLRLFRSFLQQKPQSTKSQVPPEEEDTHESQKFSNSEDEKSDSEEETIQSFSHEQQPAKKAMNQQYHIQQPEHRNIEDELADDRKQRAGIQRRHYPNVEDELPSDEDHLQQFDHPNTEDVPDHNNLYSRSSSPKPSMKTTEHSKLEDKNSQDDTKQAGVQATHSVQSAPHSDERDTFPSDQQVRIMLDQISLRPELMRLIDRYCLPDRGLYSYEYPLLRGALQRCYGIAPTEDDLIAARGLYRLADFRISIWKTPPLYEYYVCVMGKARPLSDALRQRWTQHKKLSFQEIEQDVRVAVEKVATYHAMDPGFVDRLCKRNGIRIEKLPDDMGRELEMVKQRRNESATKRKREVNDDEGEAESAPSDSDGPLMKQRRSKPSLSGGSDNEAEHTQRAARGE